MSKGSSSLCKESVRPIGIRTVVMVLFDEVGTSGDSSERQVPVPQL